MAQSRSWLGWILVPIGLLAVAISGMWVFMSVTAPVLHPNPQAIPSVTREPPRPKSAPAVERALLFEPGTQYRYSSYGWILVSAAVEAAAGQPFLTFMQERVFDPLEMRDTIPDSPPAEPDDDFPLFNLIREKILDPRTTREKTPDSAKKPVQDRVTPYFPRFSADPNYGLHLMLPPRLFLLRRIERIPIHSVRPGALRNGDPQRQALAARHRSIASDAAEIGFGRGYGLRSWLGLRDRHCGGETNARDRPRWRVAGRRIVVSPHSARARDRRVRDFEHVLRGHVPSRGEIAEAFAQPASR